MSYRFSKLIPSPWVFVLTGIVFNILSAVITHYFVGLNNDAIVSIDNNIKNKQVLIDSLWQSKTEVERKQEFYILFLTSVENNNPMTQRIFTRFQEHVKALITAHDLQNHGHFMEDPANKTSFISNEQNLDFLLDIGSEAQETIIQSINDSYFDILDLEAQKLPLEKSNTGMYSIAIFLQVIGLILVLARDLKRHQ